MPLHISEKSLNIAYLLSIVATIAWLIDNPLPAIYIRVLAAISISSAVWHAWFVFKTSASNEQRFWRNLPNIVIIMAYVLVLKKLIS